MWRLLFLPLLLVATSASAESEAVRKACAQYERETTSANQYLCGLAAFKESDEEMDHQFQELLRTIKEKPNSAEFIAAARSAQRSWVALRDRTCELESVRMGFAREYRPPICLMVLTKARSEELARYAACVAMEQSCELR